MTKLLVSAGDASGEGHAAALVRAVRARRPGVRFAGMGGPRMAAAGVELLVDQRDLAVGGLWELLGSLGRALRAGWRLLRWVRRERPDLIVLVDSGGFHLPLAGWVRRVTDAPVLYYVAPQVWAWRPRRLRRLAARADRIAVILPFEPAFYAAHGLAVDFVGHPSLDEGRARRRDVGDARADARVRLGLPPESPVLALLPGSRRNELRAHLPLQLEAFRRLRAERPGLRAIVGLAPSLDVEPARRLLDALPAAERAQVRLVEGDTPSVLDAADVALAKPGTITVELMLRRRPMVVVGRAHPWTAWLVRRRLRLAWLAMPNLLAGRAIVPELLQGEADPDRIAAAAAPLFEGPERSRQLDELARASDLLGRPGAAGRVAMIVEEMLESAGA